MKLFFFSFLWSVKDVNAFNLHADKHNIPREIILHGLSPIRWHVQGCTKNMVIIIYITFPDIIFLSYTVAVSLYLLLCCNCARLFQLRSTCESYKLSLWIITTCFVSSANYTEADLQETPDNSWVQLNSTQLNTKCSFMQSSQTSLNVSFKLQLFMQCVMFLCLLYVYHTGGVSCLIIADSGIHLLCRFVCFGLLLLHSH